MSSPLSSLLPFFWVFGKMHAGCATGTFGGTPYGATKRVRGVPVWVGGTHAGSATGTLGGAPHGATKRARGDDGDRDCDDSDDDDDGYEGNDDGGDEKWKRRMRRTWKYE